MIRTGAFPCRAAFVPRKPGCSWANLAVQTDHADCPVRGRRLERHRRPRHRQEAQRGVGAAGRDRQPLRRRRHHRHRHRGRGDAGRLHAAAGVADLYDQPGDQEDHAVRHRQGFHAGRLYCPRTAADRRSEQFPGQLRKRIVRARQKQAGPDFLRLGQSRQHQSHFQPS